MARLACQARAGYYPAAPEAVRGILKHLIVPESVPEKSLLKLTDLCILDPCAGEGEALQILSEGLSIPPKNVYAVELHKDRAQKARERLPEAHVLGPCSFYGAEITTGRFSIAYVNPPFDYAAGGGGNREEQEFVRRAYELLAPKGILVLVCPCSALVGNSSFGMMIDSMFEDVEVYRFPDDHRPYNEIVCFGRKRPHQMDVYNTKYDGVLGKRGWHSWEAREMLKIEQIPQLGERQPLDWKLDYEPGSSGWNRKRVFQKIGEQPDVRAWLLPLSWPPRRFAKNGLTDEEKAEELGRSPLWEQLRDPEPFVLPRPWMTPAKGHTIMLMVSGVLDGLVPSDPPHVARGYYIKKEKEDPSKGKTTENEKTGAVTVTQVYVEEPVSIVRALEVDAFGNPRIHEFRSDATETDEEESSEDDSYDEDEY